MSLFEKLKPFAGVALSFVPGIQPFMPLINKAFEATGKTVTENTTTDELVEVYNNSSPEIKAQLNEIKLAEIQSYTDIAIAQENQKASTRPAIAMKMADLFIEFARCSLALVALGMIFDVVLVLNDEEAFVVKLVLDGLPWISATYALPAMSIIQDYFARRSRDKRAMMELPEVPGTADGDSLVSKISRIWSSK